MDRAHDRSRRSSYVSEASTHDSEQSDLDNRKRRFTLFHRRSPVKASVERRSLVLNRSKIRLNLPNTPRSGRSSLDKRTPNRRERSTPKRVRRTPKSPFARQSIEQNSLSRPSTAQLDRKRKRRNVSPLNDLRMLTRLMTREKETIQARERGTTPPPLPQISVDPNNKEEPERLQDNDGGNSSSDAFNYEQRLAEITKTKDAHSSLLRIIDHTYQSLGEDDENDTDIETSRIIDELKRELSLQHHSFHTLSSDLSNDNFADPFIEQELNRITQNITNSQINFSPFDKHLSNRASLSRENNRISSNHNVHQLSPTLQRSRVLSTPPMTSPTPPSSRVKERKYIDMSQHDSFEINSSESAIADDGHSILRDVTEERNKENDRTSTHSEKREDEQISIRSEQREDEQIFIYTEQREDDNSTGFVIRDRTEDNIGLSERSLEQTRTSEGPDSRLSGASDARVGETSKEESHSMSNTSSLLDDVASGENAKENQLNEHQNVLSEPQTDVDNSQNKHEDHIVSDSDGDIDDGLSYSDNNFLDGPSYNNESNSPDKSEQVPLNDDTTNTTSNEEMRKRLSEAFSNHDTSGLIIHDEPDGFEDNLFVDQEELAIDVSGNVTHLDTSDEGEDDGNILSSQAITDELVSKFNQLETELQPSSRQKNDPSRLPRKFVEHVAEYFFNDSEPSTDNSYLQGLDPQEMELLSNLNLTGSQGAKRNKRLPDQIIDLIAEFSDKFLENQMSDLMDMAHHGKRKMVNVKDAVFLTQRSAAFKYKSKGLSGKNVTGTIVSLAEKFHSPQYLSKIEQDLEDIDKFHKN